MLIFIYSDYSSIFKEIIDSIKSIYYVQIVKDPVQASIALVLMERPIRKITDLLDSYPHLSVLTTMIPHDFKDKRVYFLNSRMRDLNVNCFVNYLWQLRNQISHVDIKICYSKNLNLKTEVMEAMSVVSMLVGIGSINFRFSFNDNAVHVSGYDRERNITVSCYVNNGGSDAFYEEIEVITRRGERYVLTGSDELGPHSYEERYCASWQTILEEVSQKNRYYQQNIDLIILKVKGPSRSSTGGGRRPPSRPENGRPGLGRSNGVRGAPPILDQATLLRLSNTLNSW